VGSGLLLFRACLFRHEPQALSPPARLARNSVCFFRYFVERSSVHLASSVEAVSSARSASHGLTSFQAQSDCLPSTPPLSGCSDIVQVKFDEGAHLRRLPLCIFGLFGPDVGQVTDFSRFLGIFEHGERLKKDLALAFLVAHLADGPSVRICNGCRSGDAHESVEFRGGCQYYGGESGFFEEPGSQPHGLAAEGSGRGEHHRFDPLFLHFPAHWLYGFL
jgi:hypothetical protein